MTRERENGRFSSSGTILLSINSWNRDTGGTQEVDPGVGGGEPDNQAWLDGGVEVLLLRRTFPHQPAPWERNQKLIPSAN